jgi:fatty acid-binding protein DegV
MRGGNYSLKKIAWVTDSVSCISEDTAEKYGFNVVPLSIIFDGNCYKDGIELTNEEFYKKLKASNTNNKSACCR